MLLVVCWALSIFGGVLADSAAAPSNATVDHLPAAVVIGSGLALFHGMMTGKYGAARPASPGELQCIPLPFCLFPRHFVLCLARCMAHHNVRRARGAFLHG